MGETASKGTEATCLMRNFHRLSRCLVGIRVPALSSAARAACCRLLRDWAGLYKAVVNKYYIDELYAALFVKPLMAGSTAILWHGIDQGCDRRFAE